ncbi:hypothetical protein AB205_0202700, partial [Aquarana catesbeiana]
IIRLSTLKDLYRLQLLLHTSPETGTSDSQTPPQKENTIHLHSYFIHRTPVRGLVWNLE